MADRLGWKLIEKNLIDNKITEAIFKRSDNKIAKFRLIPLPIGNPSIHPGQIVGLRLICKPNENLQKALCVILAADSGERMRLEAGGMASMELIEQVVPIQLNSVEMDVARLLSSSRGSTSPLLSSAAPLAAGLLNSPINMRF